jgi:hypothetical protein
LAGKSAANGNTGKKFLDFSRPVFMFGVKESDVSNDQNNRFFKVTHKAAYNSKQIEEAHFCFSA